MFRSSREGSSETWTGISDQQFGVIYSLIDNRTQMKPKAKNQPKSRTASQSQYNCWLNSTLINQPPIKAKALCLKLELFNNTLWLVTCWTEQIIVYYNYDDNQCMWMRILVEQILPAYEKADFFQVSKRQVMLFENRSF